MQDVGHMVQMVVNGERGVDYTVQLVVGGGVIALSTTNTHART